MTAPTNPTPKKRFVKGWLPHKPVLVVQGSTGGSWLVSMLKVDGVCRLDCNCPACHYNGDCPHLAVAAEYLERGRFRAMMATPQARERWPEQHKMYVQTHGDHHRIIARREARLQSANSGPRLEDIFAG